MKKLIAMLAVVGAVLSGVAMGMSAQSQSQIDDAEVHQKIDARLHHLLVQARIDRQTH